VVKELDQILMLAKHSTSSGTRPLALAIASFVGTVILSACTPPSTQVRSQEALSSCNSSDETYPWCSDTVPEAISIHGQSITENRRKHLRQVLQRAFPNPRDRTTFNDEVRSYRPDAVDISNWQARRSACQKYGPSVLLQEVAKQSYAKTRPFCTVPLQSRQQVVVPFGSTAQDVFYKMNCASSDWCVNNGMPLPDIRLDDRISRCDARPDIDLFEVSGPRVCESDQILDWASKGDNVARLILFQRKSNVPSYKNDLVLSSVPIESALNGLAIAASPSESYIDSKSTCRNSSTGVMNADCSNYGLPDAQVEMAVAILGARKVTVGWRNLAKELSYFASANGYLEVENMVQSRTGNISNK
jgi:hypothetical protein